MKIDDDNSISIGVEEEYFLIDPESRALVSDPPAEILEDCQQSRGTNNFVPELMRSQIEATTSVCGTLSEVRSALHNARRTVLDATNRRGLAFIASSLHPFSTWQEQKITPLKRFERIADAMQHTARQMLSGGLHVHAGFGNPDLRIQVMTAMRRYMPALLALATSSPFSNGYLTGFKSYRSNAFGSLPRTGIPNPFRSHSDFESLVEKYRSLGFIDDAREIWWDIRPSKSFPTMELRICDICPRIDDAMCVISTYICLVRYLSRQASNLALPPEPDTELIVANKWLAQRYGVFAFFGDMQAGGTVDIADEIKRIHELIMEDAIALDCVDDVMRASKIVSEGSSADRQMDLYRLRIVDGESKANALLSVVDLVRRETCECLD